MERQDDQMLVILLSMQELTVYYAFGFDLTAYKSRKQCILNGRIRGGVVNYPKTYRFLKKLLHESYTNYKKTI